MLLNKKNDLTKKRIGFIGVGIMGEGMVYKLIEANHKLFVKKNSYYINLHNKRLFHKIALKDDNYSFFAKQVFTF